MRLITITEFAREAGVDRQTIYNRVKDGDLKTLVKDLPCLRIDADKYPPSAYKARKRGRKHKAQN